MRVCKSTPFWSIWFLCGVNLLMSETMTWDFFCEVPELRIEFFRKMFFGISFSFFFFGCEFQVLRLFVLERAEDFVCYSVVVVVFRFEFGFSPNGH